MLDKFPKFKRGEMDMFYEILPKKDKKLLKDYFEYRRARGVNTDDKIKDIRRFLLQFKFIIQKEYKTFNLKDLRQFLALLNNSYLSEHHKNNIKADFKNFLKFLFRDWSKRFNNFDDLRYNSNARNEEKINASAMIKKADIDKLISHETKIYWKAFLLMQYEAGLRTKETRFLKWEDVRLGIDEDLSEVKIFATKTGKTRTLFVKEATHYLMKLKEEQENLGERNVYIFHARVKTGQPVHKSTVNMWFRRLTKRVLGVQRWNYLLRHSRATELYKLAKENKISKDTAIKFMGHSEDMSSTYTHLDKEDVKKMLKDQVYKIEDLPPEKKHQLEKDVEQHKMEILELKEKIEDMENFGTVTDNLLENKEAQKAFLRSMIDNGFGKQLMEIAGK